VNRPTVLPPRSGDSPSFTNSCGKVKVWRKSRPKTKSRSLSRQ
jgi:hypothetical protein